jgi:hypothetical protein
MQCFAAKFKFPSHKSASQEAAVTVAVTEQEGEEEEEAEEAELCCLSSDKIPANVARSGAIDGEQGERAQSEGVLPLTATFMKTDKLKSLSFIRGLLPKVQPWLPAFTLILAL